MAWQLCAMAVLGALIGLRFRVPVLILVSAVLPVVVLAGGWHAGTSILRLVVIAVAGVAALQAGYLAALLGLSAIATRRGGGLRRTRT